jgi:hypothetical protein
MELPVVIAIGAKKLVTILPFKLGLFGLGGSGAPPSA